MERRVIETREIEMDSRKWEETSFVDCSETICQAISSGNLSSELISITQGAPPTLAPLLFFPSFLVLTPSLTKVGLWKQTRVGTEPGVAQCCSESQRSWQHEGQSMLDPHTPG